MGATISRVRWLGVDRTGATLAEGSLIRMPSTVIWKKHTAACTEMKMMTGVKMSRSTTKNDDGGWIEFWRVLAQASENQ